MHANIGILHWYQIKLQLTSYQTWGCIKSRIFSHHTPSPFTNHACRANLWATWFLILLMYWKLDSGNRLLNIRLSLIIVMCWEWFTSPSCRAWTATRKLLSTWSLLTSRDKQSYKPRNIAMNSSSTAVSYRVL